MDLVRHLRFFTTVAEHRHFGHAAVALGMTQPPVSQGVQRLERHLGQRLFHRDARGVRLTEVGNALLPAAQQLLQDSERLVGSARRWQAVHQVRLGLPTDLEHAVPRLLAALADEGWSMAPSVGGSTGLLERVRSGELDVAMARHPAVVDGLDAGTVVNLPTYLALPPNDHADGDTFELLGHPLPVIVPPRRHAPAAHDQLVDALRRAGHSGTVLEVETHLERQAWHAAGHGLLPVLDPRLGRTVRGLPPLRVRVVAPVPSDRRPEIDHAALTGRLERALR
ncbi:MAG TPA: LysR family transcriptional regulator [Nocardioides sp.]|nr:LysR family transcriptional regulator [Nocardioides sp.]